MRHEVLFLNNGRSYVRINDTWYDTHKDHDPKVGQGFLIGKIEEVLDFETYIKKYPESKTEMYSYATDKTQSGGFLRKVSSERDGEYGGSMVQYGVNLIQPTPRLKQDIDLN